MQCEEYREAISARLDGEPGGVAADDLERHLGLCRACRAYRDEAAGLHRQIRVSQAPPVPDRTQQIVAALPERRGASLWRGLLLWAGLAKLAVGLPQLVPGLADSSEHLARELAAWDIALAVALLLAAWQPVRAIGLLPLLAVMAAVTLAAAGVDIASGTVPLRGEIHHLIEAVGLVALGRTAGPNRFGLRAARA